VGALNYRSLSGKGRTWELKKEQKSCSFCETGCQFDVVSKADKVIGVNARAPSKGRPWCLKGRLGMELRHNQEPPTPMLKKDEAFVELSWPEALGLEDIVDKLK
jgi:NADP-reducing hydrogenase subunit HndD